MQAINSKPDKLVDFKKNVEDWQQYFEENVKRYHHFKRFVFKTSMNEQEKTALRDTGKPTIEFNILEAYISRLRGEFAQQQPSLEVRAADGIPLSSFTPQFTQTITVIEGHLRAMFFDGTTDNLEYDVYSDLLAGGFSVIGVRTEYVNEMSMEQNIVPYRVFDPTLCGFDPLARDSHKGDGRYCFQLYPMTKQDFINQFGQEAAKNLKFTRELSGFGWSYKNEKEDIVLVCEYFEKQRQKEVIVKLTNGHVVTKKEYEEFLEKWNDDSNPNRLCQPPEVIMERQTFLTKIMRYRFCENKILDKKPTNFKFLPLVFIDGNSVNLTEGQTSGQMTRPYVYHAEGIQRLKNFAGQSLANELENTLQSKLMAAIESIPSDYQEAYRNYQKSDVILYNYFHDSQNPESTLPAPQTISRTPIPPEIAGTFQLSDEITQAILGSYDSNAQIQQAPLSGVAFARSALQSNTASVPYVVGYIKGLNRIAEIIVDLIPKYYRTPRSLPIIEPNGERSYVAINKTNSLYMNFDPNSLQVKVDVGVNFAMQKEIALQTLLSLMKSSPIFAQFMNQEGLQVLLDNIDIRGIEGLKEKAQAFQMQMEQAQQQQQQLAQTTQQMQQQEMALKVAQAQKDLQSPTAQQVNLMKAEHEAQMDEVRTSLEEKNSETQFLQVMNQIRNSDVQNELKKAEIDAENTRSIVDSSIKLSEHMANQLGDTEKAAQEQPSEPTV